MFVRCIFLIFGFCTSATYFGLFLVAFYPFYPWLWLNIPAIHGFARCIIYCWLIPSLCDFQLMYPHLVFFFHHSYLADCFSWSWILGASHLLLWSPSPSVLFVPAPTPYTCWSEILFSRLPLWYAPAAYCMEFMNMSSNHPVLFVICCSVVPVLPL